MDQGLVLTIVGTVATLFFGAWGIYLTIRQRYPGRMLFVEEDCIGLFDSIVRNLPQLSVQFNGAPVKENLVLLKGFLLNTGRKDISQSMVEQRLRANLPDGYRWLTATVVAASPAVKASVQATSETSLEFDLGLFRCGEFFRFEALAEVPTVAKDGLAPAARLERDLTFDHRIADTGRVNTAVLPPEEDLPPSEDRRAMKRPILIAFLVMVILLAALIGVIAARGSRSREYAMRQEAALLFLLSDLTEVRPPFSYVVQSGGRKIVVEAIGVGEKMLIRQVDGEYLAKLTAQEFNAMKPEIKYPARGPMRLSEISLRFTLLALMLTMITAGGLSLLQWWKNHKFRKLLAASRGDRP